MNVTEIRRQFELWAKQNYDLNLERNQLGGYARTRTQIAYDVWKAGYAAGQAASKEGE